MDNPTEKRQRCFTHNATLYSVQEDGQGFSLFADYRRNKGGVWRRLDGARASDALNACFEKAYQQLIGGAS